ncbi:hypothetical protein M1614_00240 [Candidatus Marsarchaeota archaeon]|jgi:tRNA threonylcarbamoyladenosine modification (KEOPS) complex  Pcc1 subunit|nr:hypothetical protein [Candidatus Marsarchaeota archaeon]MCL5090172.1 hypothetical protein [Candidatus Marsarchaeota archaeon]
MKFKNSSIISIKKINGLEYKKILNFNNHKRSSIDIEETPSIIKFKVYANDITALRASINAVLRDIQTIDNTSMVDIPKK